MKQCRDRNCDMLENCSISGKHPFEVDFKQRVDIAVNIPTGEKTSFLGIPCEKSNRYRPLQSERKSLPSMRKDRAVRRLQSAALTGFRRLGTEPACVSSTKSPYAGGYFILSGAVPHT